MSNITNIIISIISTISSIIVIINRLPLHSCAGAPLARVHVCASRM